MENKILAILSDYKYHKSKEFHHNSALVRQYIRKLRRAGYPIISDSKRGYKLLKNNAGIETLKKELEGYKKRALSILKTYNELMQVFFSKKLEKQQLKIKF